MGNGCDFSWNALPSGWGWTRIQDATPQKGDILVWVDGYEGCGHVAICGGPNKYYHQRAEGPYVSINENSLTGGFYVEGYWANYWGVIRPKFASSVPLSTPTISFNKSSYTVGDTITVSWVASPSDSNLSHYWIQVTDPSGGTIAEKGLVLIEIAANPLFISLACSLMLLRFLEPMNNTFSDLMRLPSVV